MSTNKILLSKKNLMANLRYLSSLNKRVEICPVLKSNAYGHGLIDMAKMLDNEKLPFFCVNNIDEAETLLENKIKTPIHIMGYVDPEDLLGKNFPFSYTIYNFAQLSAINKYQKGASVHIFVDTGMHREGFRLEKLHSLLASLKSFPNIKVTGIMSHFASAGEPAGKQTISQIESFNSAVRMVNEYGIDLKYKHIMASIGFLNFTKNNKLEIGNIARVGKALYGLDPRGKNPNLKPILKFTSRLVQVKVLEKNSAVGYDATYLTKKKTTIGILPIGYSDGLDRRLSNIGCLLIGNTHCPIVGRISMNITTIDISKIENPRVGKEVIIISENPKDPNSIENFAKISNTIPYDIAVGVNPFIKRIY